MRDLTKQAREAAWQVRQAASRMVAVAVALDHAEGENKEWREWCMKVAHAVGWAGGCEGIGDDAAAEARAMGAQSIRRAILGRLHERNAERNAALSKLEALT
jgi:hypothetical protein